MENAAPMLAYDESLNRDALTIQRRDGVLRVITPPLRRWRTMPIGFWVGVALLIAVLGPLIVMSAREVILHGTTHAAIALVAFLAPLALLFGLTWYQLGEHFCFDINDDSLLFRRLLRGRELTSRMLDRSRIRAVRVNDLQKLEIVLVGDDPIELIISHSSVETRRAVDALHDALSTCPEANLRA